MNYVVVIEKTPDGSYSAYAPDLPGCVACGDTIEETTESMREAVNLHVQSLRDHDEPVPGPSAKTVTIHAA